MLDADFPLRPDVLLAVSRNKYASFLFVSGLCHCHKNHTGGFVSRSSLVTFGVRQALKAAEALVSVGLWRQVEDGWWFVPGNHFRLSQKRQALSHLKSSLIAELGPTCAYCKEAPDHLDVEHLIPVCRGGSNERRNLVLACHPCNRRKGTMTAAEFGFPHLEGAAR